MPLPSIARLSAQPHLQLHVDIEDGVAGGGGGWGGGGVAWSDRQPNAVWHAGMAGMPAGGMMPGMYRPQGMPHLPQLAQPNMMAQPNTTMGYGPLGPQQAFGATNHGSGSCLLY